MDLITPVLIGIALSMDCFAVSLAIGTSVRSDLLRVALVIAASFGLFQAGMTLLGWGGGTLFAGYIAGFDHWLAFILLAIIGVKMIAEGVSDEEEEESISVLAFMPVLALSLATSMDALAVGVSFAVLGVGVLVPAAIIGIMAFVFSFGGVLSGMRLKSVLGTRIEILGGIILILTGANILITHLAAI